LPACPVLDRLKLRGREHPRRPKFFHQFVKQRDMVIHCEVTLGLALRAL
jgi:hypothetical protein